MNMKEVLRKKTKGKKGFTLVELVIVIAVLAIIAAIAIPTVSNVINNANDSADKSNAQSIELTIKTAQSENAAGTLKSGVTATGTLSDLLKAYGVDPAILDKTKKGDSFYYDNSNGKVTPNDSKKGDKMAETSTYDLNGTDGIVTISAGK